MVETQEQQAMSIHKSISRKLKVSKRSSKLGQHSKESKAPLRPMVKQQKTKLKNIAPAKTRKRRVYSDKELGIPKLNMITPVGVQKPRGKKKGKVFVDDAGTMQTILAMVNAEKEGQIESKMLRARQMEEIREARQKEAEAKEERKKQALESKKDELRKKNRREYTKQKDDTILAPAEKRKTKKSVSFE